MSVWILIFYMSYYPYSNSATAGVIAIDNIATQAECERVQKVLQETNQGRYTRCIEVRKAKS